MTSPDTFPDTYVSEPSSDTPIGAEEKVLQRARVPKYGSVAIKEMQRYITYAQQRQRESRG